MKKKLKVLKVHARPSCTPSLTRPVSHALSHESFLAIPYLLRLSHPPHPQAELEKFKDSVVGVRAATVDFDPRDMTSQEVQYEPNVKEETKIDIEVTNEIAKEPRFGTMNPAMRRESLQRETGGLHVDSISERSIGGLTKEAEEAAAAAPAAPEPASARWYWKEDAANISKHNPADVINAGTGFYVSYAMSVCNEVSACVPSHQPLITLSSPARAHTA